MPLDLRCNVRSWADTIDPGEGALDRWRGPLLSQDYTHSRERGHWSARGRGGPGADLQWPCRCCAGGREPGMGHFGAPRPMASRSHTQSAGSLSVPLLSILPHRATLSLRFGFSPPVAYRERKRSAPELVILTVN